MNLNLFSTWTFRGFAIEIIAKKAQCAWTAALTERPIVRRFNRWPDRHQFSDSCLLTRSAFNAPALGFGLIAELWLQLKLSKSRRMSITRWVGKNVKAWNANCLIATQFSRLHLWDSINLITYLSFLASIFGTLSRDDGDVRARRRFEVSVFASYDWPVIGAASGSFDARFFMFSLIQLSNNCERKSFLVPECFFVALFARRQDW